MKGGIITYFWSNNIGALIQCISLREFLNKKLPIDFEFENYMPNELVIREKTSPTKTFNPVKYFKAYKKNLYLDNWKKKIAKLPNYIIKKENKDYNKDFYVYGSDEIWNYENPFFKYDEYYYGNINKRYKVAYAVSVGNLNFKKNQIPSQIEGNIKTFKNIIVRDENTFEFVKSITKVKPFVGCDPSFLITPDILSGKNSEYAKSFDKKDYIMVYGLYFSSEQVKKIKRYSKQNELKIVSVCYYNIWADMNILSVDPNDFIQLMKNSHFIVTSMFHGIMLSYKNKKNFWFSSDPYRKNKIKFFLDKFELNNRELTFLSNECINFSKNKSHLDDWIDESKDKLLKSFNL